MKRILVTGGAGFIGSNFIYLLLEKRCDWDIHCIDSLTYAADIHKLDKALKYKNFHFYKIDITDRKELFNLFSENNFDVVVNFAAESHVDNSILNPGIFIHTNIIGVQNLLDACKEFNVTRFHQVSTDEVYGDLPIDSIEKFCETSPIKPSSPYSASKASADLLTLSYYRTYGLPVTISRCSNNYGPYQFKEKLIPLMIEKAIQDKSLPVYGNGLNVRDWIYVDDHCKGILDIIEKGKPGEIYNLGGNSEKSNIEIVKFILNYLNKPESLIKYVEDRKGHDLRYAIDFTKINKELGWKPECNFEDSLVSTVEWYINNYAKI